MAPRRAFAAIRTTRSHPGARLCLLTLLAVAGLAGDRPARADDEVGPLPWHSDGPIGFTLDAASWPDSAGLVLEVYVRLTPATLRRITDPRSHTGSLAFELHLRAGKKGAEQVTRQSIQLAARDTVPRYGRVVTFPFRVAPGSQHLAIRIDAQRRMLAGMGKGHYETAQLEGTFDVPGEQEGRSLSDVMFIWSGADSEQTTPPAAAETAPNAERLYGLFARTLRCRFIARAPAGDARPWQWIVRASDSTGAVLASREGTSAARPWLDATADLDVSTLRAGDYVVTVKAWQTGDPGALERTSGFSIAWEPDTWLRDAQDSEDEAHFLLQPDQEVAFGRMMLGGRERLLEDYWRARDPSPETGENEALKVFRQRVAFANQTYGRYGLGKGMFSDMGRVYIRYGEPSEVDRSVIPTGDDELATVIQQYVKTDDRPVGDIEGKAAGGDMRPFEVWVYEFETTNPFDADPHVGPTRRLTRPLVFLFVDEQWLGDYRLRYSTE